MTHVSNQGEISSPWTKQELIIFRFLFLFVVLLTVPFYGSWYSNLFSINPIHLSFQDLFQISHHIPGLNWFSTGNATFQGWIVAAAFAIAGTLIWTAVDKKSESYNRLYYWTRAGLRYRLAGGIIAYGLLLLIPVMLPVPTISDLHTAYGDFLPWKIYYHSTAVASAGYRQTIGFFEILGGLLLLRRSTVVFGSIIIFFVLVNIVLANFAYDIGEHLYSTYLIFLSAILILHDLPRLYTLLVLRTRTVADKFKLQFSKKEILFKNIVRTAFALFTILFLSILASTYSGSNWPYPDTAGLANSAGYYNVSSFKINDSIIPYSETDPQRWQDVVFEKWNVISVRSATRYPALSALPDIRSEKEQEPHYEVLGNGGRNFYRYDALDDGLHLYSYNDSTDRLKFKVERPDSTTIVLLGQNKTGDSLAIKLNKVNKEYLLYKGRRKPVSVY